MNITVIGCGETGATITSLLLSKYNGLILNILDPDNNISGKILDLEHAATSSKSVIKWNNYKSASDSNYVFFTAGTRGSVGEDRSKKAKENKQLIESIFNQFTPKTNALIITISNPTESMSYWINEHLNRKNIVVSTGTSLDTFRLQLIIAKHLNKSINNVNTMVIGEHGNNMTPLYSQTSISGDSIIDLVSEKQLNEFSLELRNSATQIRKTESATKYGVSQCAVHIFENFISPNKAKMAVSVSSEKINQLTTKNIHVSWPCKIGNHSIEVIQNIKMNEHENDQLKKAVEAINRTTNQ
ncbi:MAG: hypothetical protein WEA99_01060 [Brumimicrobium sp.]